MTIENLVLRVSPEHSDNCQFYCFTMDVFIIELIISTTDPSLVQRGFVMQRRTFLKQDPSENSNIDGVVSQMQTITYIIDQNHKLKIAIAGWYSNIIWQLPVCGCAWIFKCLTQSSETDCLGTAKDGIRGLM